VDTLHQQVVVRLGSCRYGLPMVAVAEVGRPPALTRVPGLPDWVPGVANWRGRVLAVLDVRSLLGGARSALDRSARLVVLTSGAVQVGVLVEDVEGIGLVEPGRVEPPLASLPPSAAQLLEGQLTDDAGPCGLVDVAALFALADRLPRARRAG
jgi:chemotaxis signal transduction protein